MARIQLEAAGLEFEEGGSTIWVQGTCSTLLRVKCSGRILAKCCEAPGAHADVLVEGDIHFCVASPGEHAPHGTSEAPSLWVSEMSVASRKLDGALKRAEDAVKSLCAALEDPL